MSSTRQALHFELARTGQLNLQELGLLQYIITYSSYCAPKRIQDIADKMGVCDRTIRRLIDRLVSKGLIKKRYTIHKRVILTIVNLTEQARLIGVGMVKAVVRNVAKRRKKKSQRTPVSEANRTSVAESIQEQNKEEQNSIKTDFFGFFKKENVENPLIPSGRRDPFSEIMRFREWQAQQQGV